MIRVEDFKGKKLRFGQLEAARMLQKLGEPHLQLPGENSIWQLQLE